MALDNFIVSDFVKVTTEKKKKNETTVFGTVNSYTDSDGRKYVKIDGAEELTPVMTTAELKEGDRVAILVKDHSAIIMGNITSQSASTDTVEKVKETADTANTNATDAKQTADTANTNATDAKQTADSLEERANNGEFNGADGISITNVTNWYLATFDKSTVPSVSGSDLTSKWTTDPSSSVATITSTNRYLWNYEVTTYNKGDPKTKGPVIIGIYGDKGDTGRSIESVTNYYQATSEPVTPLVSSMDNWTTDPADDKCQTSPTKRYLWNYEITIYSDSTKQVKGPIIIGTFGNTGNGIASTEIRYQGSSSGTDIPTGAWIPDIPALAPGQYLWTRTTIDYTFSVHKDISYSVSKIGEDGIGIVDTTDYYITTSDPVVPSTSNLNNWTTDPSSSDAQPSQASRYLWNYQIITYTNSSTKKIGPRIIGTYGEKGNTGAAGKGISSITEYYLVTSASSGVTASTSGWTTTIQSMTSDKRYLWNYRKTEYTTGNPTNTTPCIIGVYGDKGATGGTGATGKGVASIVDQYAKSTSDTTPPSDNDFSIQIPEWTSGEYIWRRQKITWSDNTTTYTTAVADRAFSTLFSQDIYMTGTFTTAKQMYLIPTPYEYEAVKSHIKLNSSSSSPIYTIIPEDEIFAYDIDGDGDIDEYEETWFKNAAFCRNALSTNEMEHIFPDLTDGRTYPNGSSSGKSSVTFTISLNDPNSIITIEGINIWGTPVIRQFGAGNPFAGPGGYYDKWELDNLLDESSDIIDAIQKDITNLKVLTGNISVDDALSPTSINPVQNKVIYEELEKKAKFKKYTKTFAKSDWAKLTEEPLYMVQITKSEHNLKNPVVANALLSYTWIDEDGVTQENVQSSIDIGGRILSTGTVKLYVNYDIEQYEKYDLKIILQGD